MANNGRQGEALFQQKMEALGHIVEDVSGDPQFWKKDVDFLVTSSTSGQIKSFECKWDTRINQTGNLFIETFNPRSSGMQGWFNFCEADYLAYGNAATQQFFVIEMAYLKQFMRDHKHKYTYKTCADGAEGYLIPLAALEYKIL